MIRQIVRSGLVVPLVVVAVLASVLGFFVTREIAPDAPSSPVRVSVVALPSTPTPKPTPTPSPEETPEPTEDTSSSRGRGSNRDPSCPSGCECQHPAGGIVIICR